jgi:hypothetical protein
MCCLVFMPEQAQYDGFKADIVGVTRVIIQRIIDHHERCFQLICGNIHHSPRDRPVAFTDQINLKSTFQELSALSKSPFWALATAFEKMVAAS